MLTSEGGGDVEKLDQPIAITGMHRSGTSMVTRALHDSGLALLGPGADELIEAAEDNPEGFWENKAIVACNDELLEAVGGAWDRPPALPPQAVDDPRVAHIADAAIAAVTALRQHDHWAFKDPRTCLTAAYWLDLEPRLRFIICVRHPVEVALSLKRRNGQSYSLGLALWQRYYTTVLQQVPAERRIITHYDSFFVDPQGELARLCAFAGVEPAEARVRRDLRHHDVGVSLTDAGVSETTRELYEQLCRDAGMPAAAEPPADEGRVHRLVLDGAVARRHAEQRQAAIERLEEREREFRAEYARVDAERQRRIRELEQQLARRVAVEQVHELQRATTSALEAVTDSLGALHATVVRTERQLGQIEQRTAVTAHRVEVIARSTVPLGQAFARVKRWPRRAKRAVRRKVVKPARGVAAKTARVASPQGRKVVRELPTSVRKPLRRVGRKLRREARPVLRGDPGAVASLSARIVRYGRRLAGPRATDAARRLPEPAQAKLRRAYRQLAGRGRGRGARPVAAAGPPKTARAKLPRAAENRQWHAAYEALVDASVPQDASFAVVSARSGSVTVGTRTGATFPIATRGRTIDADLSYIAQLEALRARGMRFLVVPEGARPWFGERGQLRQHVTATYRCVADKPGAGAVFDLGAAHDQATSRRSLRAEIAHLAGDADAAPILDLTETGIAGELRGLTTFRPPRRGRLPYLDRSVDVVVVASDDDLDEARRVAARAVVVVAVRERGPVDVVAVERRDEPSTGRDRRTVVWAMGRSDDAWRRELEARVGDATVRFAESAAEVAADLDPLDVVVAVEPGVVPLPGAVEQAVAACAGDVVAGKVLSGDGTVDAAGGTVFFDGSAALIAHGSADAAGPWHEFVRPVCWASGFAAAPASLWREVTNPTDPSAGVFLREWCGNVWAAGRSVQYHPQVVAVRVSGAAAAAAFAPSGSVWQRVADVRPRRPAQLGDGEWRYLLAHDDVEACRA